MPQVAAIEVATPVSHSTRLADRHGFGHDLHPSGISIRERRMAESSWYFVRNGQQQGPVSSTELRQSVAPTDLVWKNGMPEWVPAHAVPGCCRRRRRRWRRRRQWDITRRSLNVRSIRTTSAECGNADAAAGRPQRVGDCRGVSGAVQLRGLPGTDRGGDFDHRNLGHQNPSGPSRNGSGRSSGW